MSMYEALLMHMFLPVVTFVNVYDFLYDIRESRIFLRRLLSFSVY